MFCFENTSQLNILDETAKILNGRQKFVANLLAAKTGKFNGYLLYILSNTYYVMLAYFIQCFLFNVLFFR